MFKVTLNQLDCSDVLKSDPSFVNPPVITFDSTNTIKSIFTGFMKIFQSTPKDDCVVTECSLLDQGCVGSLTTDKLIFGSSSPFSLDAKANVPNGYTLNLCFQCKVKPTDLSAIDVVQDSIKIEAAPLNCSNSMTDKSFQNPLPIEYDST